MVYPNSVPWDEKMLGSHLDVFPEGQFVAVETETNRIVGMAASLIISWDDYEITDNWQDFTDSGMFTNHLPVGRTLYGAEVMVDPSIQGRGVGGMIYKARRDLARQLKLKRIRAGARLRGYHLYASKVAPEEYVRRVISKEIIDRTLTFQLKKGFKVIGIAPNYLQNDPESLGYAAVIEWINHAVAHRKDYEARESVPAFFHRRE